MLVLRPYSIPIKPTKERVEEVLGEHGILIDTEGRKQEDGSIITLKRWAQEHPSFKTIDNLKEFAIIRVFIQYIETNPETDFDEGTMKTKVDWQSHRLSRIVTLWIPLVRNVYNFLLSVGNITESDVKFLLTKLISPKINEDTIEGKVFDFRSVRAQNSHGWMQGFENRPQTIQRGILYGDFNFSQKSELDDFFEKPDKSDDGPRSNQEGIILSWPNGKMRKVRVLRFGKFQLMGIQKECFYRGPERIPDNDVLEECFLTARELLACV